MTALLKSNVSIAWLVLTVLTVISWSLGAEHGLSDHTLASLIIIIIIIIVVATFKIRIVGLYFMELREAPLALRAVYEAYCVLLAVVLTAMYLIP
jgi:tellurite resistance protein TehA-like permease